MKFGSRKDLWLSVVIWLTIVLLVGAGLSPIFKGGAGYVGGSIIFVLCTAFAGLMAWLWLGTYYELTDTELRVRSGPMVKAIPYHQIEKASRTNSWMASSALSSRRVEVMFNKYDFIHLSPMDEDVFLAELRKRCPDARIGE